MPFYDPPDSRMGFYGKGTRNGNSSGIELFPIQRNIMDYGAVQSSNFSDVGANDSALSSAIAACSPGYGVLIPSGRYQFSHFGIDAWYAWSNKMVVGEDMETTLMDCWGGNAVSLGYGANWDDPTYARSTIIGGLERGSTVITVATTGGGSNTFIAGRMAKIYLENENVTPVLDYKGLTKLRFFMVYVTAVTSAGSGYDLTLLHPLGCDFPAPAGATISQTYVGPSSRTGVGSMTIDFKAGGGQTGIVSNGNSIDCWFKDIKIKNWGGSFAFKTTTNVNFEVDGLVVQGTNAIGAGHANVLLETNSNSLFNDICSVNGAPDFQLNQGNFNSAFVGLFSRHGDFNFNHGPLNAYNLFEACDTGTGQSDGYHGGSLNDIFFRCRLRGFVENPGVAGIPYPAIYFRRLTRDPVVFGCEIQTPGASAYGDDPMKCEFPNIGNPFSYGTPVNNKLGVWWFDHAAYVNPVNVGPRTWTGTLTTRTSDTSGVVTFDSTSIGEITTHSIAQVAVFSVSSLASFDLGCADCRYTISGDTIIISSLEGGGVLPAASASITFYAGVYGFQEPDAAVRYTLLRICNSYVDKGDGSPPGISTDEVLPGGYTLRDSYVHASKPARYGSLQWPAFNPFVYPGDTSLARTPAGYYHVNGAWPDETPPDPASTPQPRRRSASFSGFGFTL